MNDIGSRAQHLVGALRAFCSRKCNICPFYVLDEASEGIIECPARVARVWEEVLKIPLLVKQCVLHLDRAGILTYTATGFVLAKTPVQTCVEDWTD